MGEDVEAARLHLDAFDVAVVAGGEWQEAIKDGEADLFFVIADGFDIDEGARQFENVHINLSEFERGRDAGLGACATVALHPASG